MVVRRCPTLPRPRGRSTIGAEGLSFRVRDGSGRFPPRYGRRNSMEISTPGPPFFVVSPGGVVGVVVAGISGTAQWTRNSSDFGAPHPTGGGGVCLSLRRISTGQLHES